VAANCVTLDETRRDEAIEAAYASAVDRLPGLDAADFAKAVADWDVYPVVIDGKTAGAILVNGCEIHACVLPEAFGRWFSKRSAKVLAGVIAKHGRAVTSATTPAGRAFVERLGFVEVNSVFVKGP
jgi:hypothetical protein